MNLHSLTCTSWSHRQIRVDHPSSPKKRQKQFINYVLARYSVVFEQMMSKLTPKLITNKYKNRIKNHSELLRITVYDHSVFPTVRYVTSYCRHLPMSRLRSLVLCWEKSSLSSSSTPCRYCSSLWNERASVVPTQTRRPHTCRLLQSTPRNHIWHGAQDTQRSLYNTKHSLQYTHELS